MRTILIVDDNVDLTNAVGLILEDQGFNVRIAHHAIAALEEAATLEPEAALLDLGLPGGITGTMLCTRLRELYGVKIRLLAFTGSGSRYDDESVPAGFDGLVKKPATVAQILAAIGTQGTWLLSGGMQAGRQASTHL